MASVRPAFLFVTALAGLLYGFLDLKFWRKIFLLSRTVSDKSLVKWNKQTKTLSLQLFVFKARVNSNAVVSRVANTESRICTATVRCTGLRQYGGTFVSFGVVMVCGLMEVRQHVRESFCLLRRASYPRKHVGIFELASRGSSVVIMFGLRAGRSGVEIPEGARLFLFSKSSTPAPGFTTPPVQCTRVHSRG